MEKYSAQPMKLAVVHAIQTAEARSLLMGNWLELHLLQSNVFWAIQKFIPTFMNITAGLCRKYQQNRIFIRFILVKKNCFIYKKNNIELQNKVLFITK